jgi:general secretion pathway protein B
MSFILDALKKSEIERQRQSVPGLIEIPSARRRRAIPVWGWVLVGLLGINMAILLVLVLRSPAPPASHARVAVAEPQAREVRPREPAARAAPAPEAAPQPDHFSPLDSAPVYAPEIPVPDNGASAGNEPQSGAATIPAPSTSTPRAEAPVRNARRADPVLNDEPSDDDEMLPSINELNLTGTHSLPDIHLDVHVYATRSADRFVYINMRKYREGSVLQEGPTLERIRRDGVVLNYNGLRFFVPRQS